MPAGGGLHLCGRRRDEPRRRSCEASLERSDALRHPPTLTVTRLAFEPGLARTRVRVGDATTIALDVVRSGRRWLVSFVGGADPVAAVGRADGS